MADRKLLYHPKIYALQERCSRLDLFRNVASMKNPEVLSPLNLYCFYEEGAKISSLVAKKAYWFFMGNTCISYHKSGYDRVIRIFVKDPGESWEVGPAIGEDGNKHFNVSNECVKVYAWWNVDWLGMGKPNCDSALKTGAWWKSVYDDICRIYEEVAKLSVDRIFDDIYTIYDEKISR